MANRAKDTVLVGVVGTVGIAIIAVSVVWLRGIVLAGKETGFKVILPDARGLKGAEEVRIAGYKVGRVGKVGLAEDGRSAKVELLVETKYKIPKDSKIQVTPPLLGGQVVVSIVPGSPTVADIEEGETVKGTSAAGIDEITGNVNKIVGDPKTQQDLKATLSAVRQSTEALKTLLADPNLKRTLRGVSDASAQLPKTVAQTNEALEKANRLMTRVGSTVDTLSTSANRVMGNVDSLTASGAGAAKEGERTIRAVRGTVEENRAEIKGLLVAANDAMAGVAALSDRVGELIGDESVQKNFVAATANLTESTKNIAAITAKLDATAANVQKLSGDEQLTGDLKATLGNVKETTASFSRLTARLENLRLPGEKRTGAPRVKPPPPPPASLSLLEPGLIFDAGYDTVRSEFRLDSNFTLPTQGGSRFYRVGLDDATEGNRLNVQFGSAAHQPARSDYRYGLFAGKLGAGLDLRTLGFDWRLDAYDPNRLTVNLRAKKYLDPDTALTAGIRSLGNGNRATVGIQFRR